MEPKNSLDAGVDGGLCREVPFDGETLFSLHRYGVSFHFVFSFVVSFFVS